MASENKATDAKPADGKGKKPRPRWKRRVTGLLLLAGLAGVYFFTPCCSIVNESIRPAPPPVPEGAHPFGEFHRVQGKGVLVLWGEPYQRGLAHGSLLAQGVLDMADTVCGSNLLLSDTKDYERVILPMMDKFAFEADDAAELRGVLDGVRSKLGTDARLARLGRALTLADLKAYNTAGDWYRQACSSFAAWGGQAADGHVWVGRNFDFMPAKAFFSHQMIIVHRPAPGKKAWASVTAPGMIGCLTGINQEGVFVSVHDVFKPLRPVDKDYSPRLLVLRRLIETCSARDLQAQALPILTARKAMFDNAILLAAPVADGTSPGLIFEYDSDPSQASSVTVRTPQDNEKELSQEMITCTNHFRKRAKPSGTCYRYPLMRQVLMAKTGRGQKVDFDIARKTMGAVRLPITVHTAIADLNTREFWLAEGEFLSPPGNHDYVKLPMKEWLTGR